MRILFFSRGRGRGHALPDLAIASRLEELDPAIQVNFASYGRGLQVLRSAGRDAFDLGLPENTGVVQALVACAPHIAQLKPGLVVSHEEFGAHPAAALFGIPSIFLSAWFPPIGTPQMEALEPAAGFILLGQAGLFPPPPNFKGVIDYTGPVVRPSNYSAAVRPRARAELGVPAGAPLFLVVPGVWTEQESPISAAVIAAFRDLALPGKRLIWQSKEDYPFLVRETHGIEGIQVFDYLQKLDQILAAADVVITKGTAGITMEALAMGVPTISLTHYKNFADNIVISNVKSNVALNGYAVTGPILAAEMAAALGRKVDPAEMQFALGGCDRAARALLDAARRLARPAIPTQDIRVHPRTSAVNVR